MSAPDRLGRLRKVRLLGSGGFATVWLYHDDELDSDVAVKVLADNWAANDSVRDRFLAESRLLRSCSSHHLVQVYDVGFTPSGSPYFVMSYADRGSVADLLEAPAPPTPREVVDIVDQTADGLAVLHEKGIVHRDVKPANLLFGTGPGGSRRLMVADLGVARLGSGAGQATQAIGTPDWMAPEQFDGSVAPDARADVRSLGAVAYALIAGRPPRAPGLFGPVTPLSQVSGAPPAVEAAVMRALEPDREHRWPDVRSFAQAFSAAVHGTASASYVPSPHATATAPTPAPPHPESTPRPTPGPSPKRSRWPLVAALALALVVIGGLLVRQLTADGGSDVENAYEVAAVRFIDAIQARDCDTAGTYLGMPEGWDCANPPDDEFHWAETADWINSDGETRVEDIGDGQIRVVFVKQGYVVVHKRSNSTMEVVGLVGHVDGDPDGRQGPTS